MDSSEEDWTQEEKAFIKGATIGAVTGALITLISTTILFLIIGLYY